MSSSKLLSMLFIIIGLAAGAAEARGAHRPVGRVVAVEARQVEFRLARGDVPVVGASYDVRRRRGGPPKDALSDVPRTVGRVRVESVLANGDAQAVLIEGSAWRGDGVREVEHNGENH
jgi:hypothetical protein